MAEFQIAWNPTTKVATAQAAGAAAPGGSTVIATHTHNDDEDPLGIYGKTHVLFHHVREALYHLDPSFTDMAAVTITAEVPIGLTDFEISQDTLTLAPAGTSQLTMVFTPDNVANKVVAFDSSNVAVATVNATTGLVTGVANGVAVITGITDDGGFTDTVSVTVATPVTAVSSTPATASLAPLGTQQITNTFTPPTASNQNVTYGTSDPLIATVSPTGLITAVAVGSATITVTTEDGAFTDTVVVTVA
jgi:hypothetical protein